MQGPVESSTGKRIRSLDGLRFIAIAQVLLFHYYARWTPPRSAENLYAFGSRFADNLLFRHSYGIELFFIVSGFVITFSLFRCRSLIEFAVRRFARLWPSMLLCSLITLVVLKAVGQHFNAKAIYLAPSLTFTDPSVFNNIFGSDQFRYMDGAHWTMFVELRFYVLVSALYFASATRFARTVLVSSLAVLPVYIAARALHASSVVEVIRPLFIAEFLPWFLLGVGVLLIHSGKEVRCGQAIFGVGFAAVVAAAAVDRDWTAAVACTVPVAVFVGALRSAWFGRLLSGKLPVSLGCASYSLFLLHQFAGIELTSFVTARLSLQGAVSAVVPLFTAAALWVFSMLIFRFFEMPVNKWIVARYRAFAAARSGLDAVGGNPHGA